MTRPTSRVLALLEILQGGGTHRVADLAGRLGVDERTVRRYAEHLLDLDVPVRTVRGRYGGYHLAPGYRMPPLMLTDEEAVAVMLGLALGRRAGLVPGSVAAESALAKLRRVMPTGLRDRLGALLAVTSFTAPPGDATPTATSVLLTLAEAARDGHPVDVGYRDRRDRATSRAVHPQGVVGHAGRWYLVADTPRGRRTFRLDRISSTSPRPGSFTPSPSVELGPEVLALLAATPWAHEVSFRVRGTLDDVERRLPLGLAVVEPVDGAWVRVRLHAERLGWVPALLASLDRPFVVEHPPELRQGLTDLAAQLATWAAATD